ncbi:MAG: inorganic phosphate transporter [Pseudomonadota bacterium]
MSSISLDLIYILLACGAGLFMTWGVGANDLANIMSTTMGSKAITPRQAIVIAVLFEFAGAFFGSGQVTSTIRTGIININLVNPEVYLIYGMLAILMAGSVWMTLASVIGMPVSITNAIVGGLVGFGASVLGVDTIHWEMVRRIAISWVCSPLIAGLVSYLLFVLIQKRILSRSQPQLAMKKFLPIFLLGVGAVLSIMVVLKGFEHFGVHFPFIAGFGLVILTSALILSLGYGLLWRIPKASHDNLHGQLVYVEKVFGILMGITACAMVFAHGSNDVAIAVGPIAAVLGVVHSGETLSAATPIPTWAVALGAFGVVLGFLTYGRKVIETVGSGITALTPSRAFSATLAAATTVIVSTSTGIPVSATQTLVGAVLGVGLARGIGALNLTVIRNIFTSWVITIPATASICIVFFFILKASFKLMS